MPVGFYDMVRKFNPYHGKDGRFTSPGGATSFFIGGSDKQKANAKAKEMLRTWSNPERDKAIKNIANKTRNLKNEQSRIIDENGNILLEKKGNRNSVAMSVGEKREFMRGNTGIHNHPDGGTFSAADLRDFGFGAKEIIVASPEGDYSLKNVNFGNRKQYDGWTRMQEALERDVKPVSGLDLLKQARKNLEDSKENRELKEISDEWNRIKDKSGLDAAKEWYKGKQERYDELSKKQKDNVQAEVRRLEVAPHHEWLQQNASNYGFDYSFTPANNVKKSFETVLQKFNPNHDKLGRFAASGSSGTGSEKGTTYKLYHGSPNANISQFDISHSGENTQSGENLLFFTDSREFADSFSYERLPGTTMVTNRKGEKGRVYEVDVTMKNPLDLRNLSNTDVENIIKLSDDDTLTADEVRRLAGRNHQLLKTYIDLQSGALKELGYDGLIADTMRGALEYAVVSNDQVKITKMVSKTFTEVIRKYNSIHDHLGRFASGHGATLQADKGTNAVSGKNDVKNPLDSTDVPDTIKVGIKDLKNGLKISAEPNSVYDKVNVDNKVLQRRYYDKDGKASVDIDTSDHNDPDNHPKNGHKHRFDHSRKTPRLRWEPLTIDDRRRNRDIVPEKDD